MCFTVGASRWVASAMSVAVRFALLKRCDDQVKRVIAARGDVVAVRLAAGGRYIGRTGAATTAGPFGARRRTSGADAIEQDSSGFVVGILRNQLTAESLGEGRAFDGDREACGLRPYGARKAKLEVGGLSKTDFPGPAGGRRSYREVATARHAPSGVAAGPCENLPADRLLENPLGPISPRPDLAHRSRPLRGEALREAIVFPASDLGVRIEPELIDARQSGVYE